MSIKVRVSSNRKCHSSIHFEGYIGRARWIISFGTVSRLYNNVEIEFTTKQLLDHQKMLNALVESDEFNEKQGYTADICDELKNALKEKPFFNVTGGCGVDMSGGESSCMDADGIFFHFCPFCGKKILNWHNGNSWQWKEK